VVKRLKKNSGPNEAGSVLNDRRGRAIPVAALLIFVVLLSMGSGIYASASFFAQQAPNVIVTTTIYTTTTSWTTSTIWSTVTQTVQGVLTTVVYTTSTSTISVTASMTSTPIGTAITLTQVWGRAGNLLVSGSLKDANGNGLQGLPVKVYVDGWYQTSVTTSSGGSFTYNSVGPTSSGTHTVTVTFDGNSQYMSSSKTATYTL
jgi:hypothetical protein